MVYWGAQVNRRCFFAFVELILPDGIVESEEGKYFTEFVIQRNSSTELRMFSTVHKKPDQWVLFNDKAVVGERAFHD